MKKVLIVDDHVDMCGILTSVLRVNGFEAACAYDGKTALEKIEKDTPDLVLLDIRLPGMDGIQVLKKLKIIRPDLPVIMLTGYDSRKSAIRSVQLGAVDYINKPFENDQIISAIKEALLKKPVELKKKLINGLICKKTKPDRN